MRIQEKQKALEQEVIANLCAIPKMPENMLPHTVYVEEEGEDGYGHGIPVYTMYRLEEIRFTTRKAGSVSPAATCMRLTWTGW